MCENGRMSDIEAVIVDFNKLMYASKKEVPATVTTVIPLEAAKVEEIKTALKVCTHITLHHVCTRIDDKSHVSQDIRAPHVTRDEWKVACRC